MDLLGGSIGSPVAVGLAAIALLQELLVLALQLVIEQHAAYELVVLAQAFGLAFVGLVKPSRRGAARVDAEGRSRSAARARAGCVRGRRGHAP